MKRDQDDVVQEAPETQVMKENARYRKWRVENFRELKETIRACDDVALPESGLYFDALEARIMGALSDAIENGEVVDRKRRFTFVPPVRFTSPIRGAAARTGHFFIVGGIALTLMGKWLMSGDGSASSHSISHEIEPDRSKIELSRTR